MSTPAQTARIRAVIDAYLEGFANKDLEAICALYAEDAVIEDPVGTPKKEGMGEIRAFYEMALAAEPRLTLTGEPHIVGAFSATPIAADVSMPNGVLRIAFLSVMAYRPDGRIAAMTAYFDPATLGA